MIIDTHTHIFPEKMRENRELFFDDQAFRLLYENKRARLKGCRELLISMEENQVDLSLILAFPWRNYHYLKAHNDFILESAKKHKGKLLAFCSLHPEDPWALEETERCLKAGAFGLGEIASYTSDFDHNFIKKIEPVMALCKDYDAPLIVHTNDPIGHNYPGKAPLSLQGIENFIKAFPENKIVLAHNGGGYPFYQLVKKGLSGNPDKLMFDTAAFPYLYKAEVYSLLVQLLGPKRLLFGSDWPLLEVQPYLDDMKKANLSDENRNLICYQNAKDFLFGKKDKRAF